MLDPKNIKERYQMGWIRDDQLKRYVDLGVITRAQAREIMGAGNEEV